MTKTDEATEEMPDFSAPAFPPDAPKLFTVGTLSYTKHGLWLLFIWLMWNDFTSC